MYLWFILMGCIILTRKKYTLRLKVASEWTENWKETEDVSCDYWTSRQRLLQEEKQHGNVEEVCCDVGVKEVRKG